MSMSMHNYQQPQAHTSILTRSSKLLQSFMRRTNPLGISTDPPACASMLSSKSTQSFNEICNNQKSINSQNSSLFHSTKNKFATLSHNYKSAQLNETCSLITESVDKWNSIAVKTWLENIGMHPSHIKSGLKHIKTGKHLLTNLSDSDLEKIFSINNQMHRRKLRLAIDDLKCLASSVKTKYPKLSEIATSWLCNVWLEDIGLCHLKETFKSNLIDGNVLASLQKKDLEKHLGISKRTQQTSLLLAVEILRRYDFDTARIDSLRKANSKNEPIEVHLWTNENFIEWLKLVNLQAFTKKLKESGLHGGLIFDSQFNADFLYDSLGVSETETRYSNMKKILEDEIRLLRKPIVVKSNSFMRSSSKNEKKSFNFRGSLGRALGKKIKRDISSPLVDDETFKRIENSHKIVEMKHVPQSVV